MITLYFSHCQGGQTYPTYKVSLVEIALGYLNKIYRLIITELTMKLREHCSCADERFPVRVCAYQEPKPSLSISRVFYLFEYHKTRL